jgi:DNA-binding NarL/FixJ family response regulator
VGQESPDGKAEKNMNDPADIMVVEDSSRARSALTAYISLQAGFKVSAEASNGAEAIDLIKKYPPDIILMDLQMPVMDGLEATQTIKKYWPQIKILALTMYPNCEAEALSAGADAFLVKGCSVHDLISTIQALAQSKEVGDFHPSANVGLAPGQPPQIA